MSEVRLDLLDLTDNDIKKIFSSGKNIIATCKTNGKLTENDSISLLTKALEAGAAYVDLDIDSSDDLKNKVMELAKKKGKKIIISYHNCKSTPSREDLVKIVNRCKNYHPDVIKIVGVSHSNNDNVRLLSLLDSDIPMIVIGMGEKGRITRFAAPLLGAFCTFVGVSQLNQTAFGQSTKEELETFLRSFKTQL